MRGTWPPYLASGKNANSSSANSTRPNTFSLLSSREARSTAAKIAAFRLSVPCRNNAMGEIREKGGGVNGGDGANKTYTASATDRVIVVPDVQHETDKPNA